MKNHKIKSKRSKQINHNLITPGSYKSKSKNKFSIKKFIKIMFVLGIIVLIALFIWFQINIKNKLPDISQIKDITFSQATIITDRNDNVLYKLFSENREYVEYSGINQNMINAIVAVEDQRYREHNGLDSIGILRAAITKVLNPASRLQGASTIPQQLVRNLLLTKDRKIERKLKEMVLTKQLDAVLEDEIKEDKGRLSKEEMNIAKKEKTLELYLNYIFLGNNAYGVEAATQTYFGGSAKDMTVLQSAILASIPKGPSLYNPYKNKTALMGKLKLTDNNDESVDFSTGGLQDQVSSKVESILSKADFSNKQDYGSFSKYIKGLLDVSLYYNGQKYNIDYSLGRKDFALSRMFEDGFITQDELKEAFLDGIFMKFENNGFPIKAPHFVMWVRELLEEQYDEDTLMNDGLVVKTTLDLDIQQIAEKAIENNIDALEMYGATNEAMIYVDSTNGDILSYIGSVDYFNEDIGGQNDMVQSARQVGSTMKPFIYSLAFDKLPLTLDTPIYDIPFQIGPDRPNNADGKFLGILPLKKALAYSRNIPAAKIITALGGEEVALPFLSSLGLTSLDDQGDYGYTLAFGAGEVPMLELATAYTHLSTTKPAKLNPILEITTHDGSLLYQKEVEKNEQKIAAGISYLMRKILSDPANQPPEWVAKYAVRGLQLGLKSGTSNMKTPKGDRARDGWLATYTPSNVAVFRGGNADGSPMYRNAYGGFLNADAMTEFWSTLLANNLISDQGKSAVEVADISISRISGKLVSEGTPAAFITQTKAYSYNQPQDYDPGMVPLEFDSSCNGLASPYTPAKELKQGYVVIPTSFMPGNMDLAEIRDWWNWSTNPDLLNEFDPELSGKVNFNYDNILLDMPQEYCDNRSPQIDEKIKIDIKNLNKGQDISTKPMIWFNVKAPNNIKRVSVSINDRIIGSTEYRGDSNDITDVIISNLGEAMGQGELTLLAVDTQGYSNRKTIDINVVSTDTTAPYMLKENVVVEKDGDKYRMIMFFNDDLSSVNGGTITQGDKVLKNFDENIADFKISQPGMLEITAKDGFDNIYTESIDPAIYISEFQPPKAPEATESTEAGEETEVVETGSVVTGDIQ